MAPIRLSNRASTSQFARVRVQKANKLAEPEKRVAKSPKQVEIAAPPPQTARNDAIKVVKPDDVPQTLELKELKQIIGVGTIDEPKKPVIIRKRRKTMGAKKAVKFQEDNPVLDTASGKREISVPPAVEPVATAATKPREPKDEVNGRKESISKPNADNTIAERAGKRLKKEKVIFDPSELQIRIRKRAKMAADKGVPKQRTSPPKPTPATLPKPPRRPIIFDTSKMTLISQKIRQFCYICMSGKGVLELTCSRCNSPAHKQCLAEQEYLTSVSILGAANWLCHSCCKCCVCHLNSAAYTVGDSKEIFVCVTCKKFYHAHCHRPSLMNEVIDKTSWTCHTCTEKRPASNGFQSLGLPTTMLPRSTVFTQHNSRKPRNIAQPLPPRLNQLHDWTVEEVYRYFTRHFPEEAVLFRDQEIDGAVLLLMRRSDVLEGFGKRIKVGAALNIYRHIVMMQTRNNDPRLTWY
jgi:hypothetical protein